MLERLVEALIGFVAGWAYLIFALSVAVRMREVTLPERPTFLKQTAQVVAATTAADLVAGAVFGGGSWITWGATAAVFWTLLNRWFDVDLQAAIWILIIGAVTQVVLEMTLLSLILANL